MTNLIITLAVIFIVLPAFFLLIFVTIPSSIRRARLKKIAERFGLSFNANVNWSFFKKADSKRNIMQGQIKGHPVEVFDSRKMKLGYIPTSQIGTSYTKTRTVILVDGNEQELKNWFSPFASLFSLASPRKIRKVLLSIQ